MIISEGEYYELWFSSFFSPFGALESPHGQGQLGKPKILERSLTHFIASWSEEQAMFFRKAGGKIAGSMVVDGAFSGELVVLMWSYWIYDICSGVFFWI